jgi:hypothetical protein
VKYFISVWHIFYLPTAVVHATIKYSLRKLLVISLTSSRYLYIYIRLYGTIQRLSFFLSLCRNIRMCFAFYIGRRTAVIFGGLVRRRIGTRSVYTAAAADARTIISVLTGSWFFFNCNSVFYLIKRSNQHGAPVLICSVHKPTAKSAM